MRMSNAAAGRLQWHFSACRQSGATRRPLVCQHINRIGLPPKGLRGVDGEIVVNPSAEGVRQANQARNADPEGARRAVESGTLVNPPAPND